MISFEKIASICSGHIISGSMDGYVRDFYTDSRSPIMGNTSAFIAIEGRNHDGHIFIPELYQLGTRCFIVEKQQDYYAGDCPLATFIKVSKGLVALQQIAAWHRMQFKIPVVAITGSNGKTIIKEWLSQLLSWQFHIVKSPKSYNSQLGVPLSVLQMDLLHELAIFEAGISKPGEMEILQKILHPVVGIFTNLGSAHDEAFRNRNEKLSEKLKLFQDVEVLIYCKDQTLVHEKICSKNFPVFTWSMHDQADLCVRIIRQDSLGTYCQCRHKGNDCEIYLPFSDTASLENAFHCMALIVWMGLPLQRFKESFQNLKNVPMRLELVEGNNNCHIINDAYNNDLAGIIAGIDFMIQQQNKPKKTVILSDVLQSGKGGDALYAEIARLLKTKNIDLIIGIGPEICQNKEVFEGNCMFFESTDNFLTELDETTFTNQTILVKGARPFRFERIVQKLQKKLHGTVLEINLEALLHNFNFYRSKIQGDTKIMVMVKALAYGSGSHQVSSLLQYHGADYLAVAYADEGIELRHHGISLPIMVMNAQTDQFEKISLFRLEPEIYSLALLKALNDFSLQHQTDFIIHLKLETGMHRLGFKKEELEELCGIIKKNPRLKVVSVFSHLAGADEVSHDEFTLKQVSAFEVLSNTLSDKLGIKPYRHILNSAGILRFPEYQYDMVRLGIGLYGFDASLLYQNKLQQVSTLKTTISQIHKIGPEDRVGYSRMGRLPNGGKVATIGIGYADGYPRILGNGKAYVKINGQNARVIGNICMDMTMVDVSHIECNEGDTAIVFGSDPDIYQLAELAHSIPYEVLTNIKDRVKRVYFSS
ncbi:MAG: bifunctional UDP-N-acetylmuramoyl-tripeptide:D-alanyl-D-alanine ligase/alanine racemase [Cyclobacteriaceae bacterium]|nr:bifunctional UDP-N-acetylmuramoyl-tripeptide:D-alanyl-D-alanine ligase/alanine racemase [Cyclobacteriaceae bacterium]